MPGSTPKKKCMAFSSRPAMERMEALLEKKGFLIHCADWDGSWFIIYSEPICEKGA